MLFWRYSFRVFRPLQSALFQIRLDQPPFSSLAKPQVPSGGWWKGDKRWEATDHPRGVFSQNWGGIEPKRTVTWSLKQRLMTDVHLAICRDEFRGPRSDVVRQVALVTTTAELGKTPKETYAMLVHVHEDHALLMKCVYEWLARFREGLESVSGKTRSGRPATSVNDENIEKVRKLITKDRRLTVRMIPVSSI
ncbi:hypothetical protein TNCV_4025981 [Trichonephila clavipes]|nr:hypothetical protein TNCV_4025981 [Trichonephila clavipes]